MKRPVITIVGRPNVGKSTLFNKLCGKRKAIVQDLPGVTRDRNESLCHYRDRQFTLVDTGGLLPNSGVSLTDQVHRQSEYAIDQSDIVLFLLDAREGVTPVDQAVQKILRESGKPIYHIINKAEGKGMRRVEEFYELGAETLYPISSEHNMGLSDMLDALYPHLAPLEEAQAEEGPKVVLMGRPNAGKSTLINTILKEDRLLTSDMPGTTRDTIDTHVTRKNKEYLFIDTAGIRKRGKVEWGVEQYSVSRAKSALKRANVALLLVDSVEGITEQDTKIAGMIIDAGRGLILLVNKSDLLSAEEDGRERVERQLQFRFPFVNDLQVLYISAIKGKGLTRLFQKIDTVFEGYTQRVTTGDLNRLFEKVIQKHPPPNHKGKTIRIYYITQASVAPPTFVLFCNIAKGLTENYIRYVQNQLCDAFGFRGVPIRMKVRARRRVSL
ncbi:ribosome biogenesis GTPase Der [Nitrospira defluvii]|nr:ribosome biogenesis GTPase Der [Nitrospira defluvii]